MPNHRRHLLAVEASLTARLLAPGAAAVRCKIDVDLIPVELLGKVLTQTGGESRKSFVG